MHQRLLRRLLIDNLRFMIKEYVFHLNYTTYVVLIREQKELITVQLVLRPHMLRKKGLNLHLKRKLAQDIFSKTLPRFEGKHPIRVDHLLGVSQFFSCQKLSLTFYITLQVQNQRHKSCQRSTMSLPPANQVAGR